MNMCLLFALAAVARVAAGVNAQVGIPTWQDLKVRKRARWEAQHVDGGLKPKPAWQGPDRPAWRNTIAVCSMIKQENSTDVREWVLYYRWLGVHHIYLTENADSPEPHMHAQLQDFIEEGFLTYNHDATFGGQMIVASTCIRQHYLEYDWLTFLDVDEFLVLRNQDETLRDLLEDFKHEAGLVVHWLFFGSSGREHRSEGGGVLQHYQDCGGENSPHQNFKTLANTFYLQNVALHPHNFEFRDDMRSVDESGSEIPHYGEKLGSRGNLACVQVQPSRDKTLLKRGLFSPQGTKRCYRQPRASYKKNATIKRVALLHYAVKSREDFQIKSDKGTATGAPHKLWDYFDQKNALGSKQRGGVCDLPAELGRQCCPPEQLTLDLLGSHPVPELDGNVKGGAVKNTLDKRRMKRRLWHP